MVWATAGFGLNDRGFQVWDIFNVRNFVVAQIGGHHFAAVIRCKLFDRSVAHPHHHGSVDLPLVRQRIQYGSGVMSRGQPSDGYLPRFPVHFYFSNLGYRGGLGSFFHVDVMTFPDDWPAVRSRDFSETHPPFGAAMSHAPVIQYQLIRRSIHRLRGDAQNLFARLLHRFIGRSPVDSGTAAAAHPRVLEHFSRIEDLDFDRIQRDF